MRQICQRIRFLNFVKGRGYGIDDDWGGNVAGDRGGGVEFCASQCKGIEGRSLCRPVYIIVYSALFLFPSATLSTLAQLSSAPPLSRFPYRRIKTAPMLLNMGAVLLGIKEPFS